jgi:hypothetical protein
VLVSDTPIRHHHLMPAAPPASTKTSLQQRLSARARWPQLANVDVRFRGAFAYVSAQLPDSDPLPLMRLRYGGSAARWASRSTAPATRTTKIPTYPTASPPAPPKTPWT